MRTRTVATWAGFVLLAVSLTGCMGSGNNQNYVRPNSGPFKNVSTPAATTATPANGSGWARQTPPATAPKPQGDPSALANPTGNTPQFNVQPTGGITPAGGLAPPAVTPNAAPVPAAAAPTGNSTSNLMPATPSINSLNAGTPVSAVPAATRQVAVNTVRAAEPATKVAAPAPPAAVTDEAPAPVPPIPPAAAASEVPRDPPLPINTLSPLPPTKVRQ